MSVTADVALPAQPTTGSSSIQPYSGDGRYAPHSEYLVDTRVAHDATGGTANLTVTMDPRYTSVVTWSSLMVAGSATAKDFVVSLARNAASNEASPAIIGAMPLVASSVTSSNNIFLWYPPPLFYQREGVLSFTVDNVDSETSFIRCQIYNFHSDVRQSTLLPFLLANFPASGGSVPV